MLDFVMNDFEKLRTKVSAADRQKLDRHLSTVREFDFGVGVRFHRLRLDWGATTRSREYTTGPSRHVYSTMSAAWEFIP